MVTPHAKVRLLEWLFLPLGLASLGSSFVLLAVPLLAERLLSANPNHWTLTHQYSAPLMPILALAAVDTVYAMTVHKSQGSQYEAVAFLVPGPESRVLTRELLYTAVTRARERLIVVGPELSIRAAIERPITRASGLRQALWGESTSGA